VDGRPFRGRARIEDREPSRQRRSELAQEQHGRQAAADEDRLVVSNSHRPP
jgi:hypothetical protein